MSGPLWIARPHRESVARVAPDWVDFESAVFPALEIQLDAHARPDAPDFLRWRHRERAHTGDCFADWIPGLPDAPPAPPPPAWHTRGAGYWFKWLVITLALWSALLFGAILAR